MSHEQHGDVQQLVDDLTRLVNRTRLENPLSWAEMIGALTIVQSDLLQEMVDDARDDGDDGREAWRQSP